MSSGYRCVNPLLIYSLTDYSFNKLPINAYSHPNGFSFPFDTTRGQKIILCENICFNLPYIGHLVIYLLVKSYFYSYGLLLIMAESSKVANRSLMEILKAEIDFSKMPWHVLYGGCLTMIMNQKYKNSKYETCYEYIMKK